MAPIHLHAENGCIEPLKCMIEADTVNMKSSSGSTPLIYAAAKVEKGEERGREERERAEVQMGQLLIFNIGAPTNCQVSAECGSEYKSTKFGRQDPVACRCVRWGFRDSLFFN